MQPTFLVVEGIIDAEVGRKLLICEGIPIANVHRKGGRSKIEAKVSGYHRASAHAPWVVLADLDNDPCAGETLAKWRVPPADERFVCRFAIREIESWLLADFRSLSRHFGLGRALLQANPDELADPKATLIRMLSSSRYRTVREDMVPEARSLMSVGPGYNHRMIEFVQENWNQQTAAENSPSLRRCVTALRQLKARSGN